MMIHLFATMHKWGRIGVTLCLVLLFPVDAGMLRGTQHRRNHRVRSRDHRGTTAITTFEQGNGILTALDPSTGTSVLFNDTTTTTKNDNSAGSSTLLDSASLIVGGSAALPNEASFFSLLLTYDKSRSLWKNYGCGGSLISDRHILTAAHCFKVRSNATNAIFVNAYTPFKGNVKNATKYPYHFSKIKSFRLHPSYINGRKAHDIAIITMERPITNTLQFPPVRLLAPAQTIADNATTNIYGFGRTFANVATSVDTLQTVSIPYVPYDECKLYYSWNLHPDMICAGEPLSRRDVCSGDSGGPMTIERNGLQYQIGVISWGTESACGQSSKPSVYSSVQYHYSWIQQTVCNTDGVDDTIELCSNATNNAFISGLPVNPLEIKSASCSSGKPDGLSCSYGGECCSGICGLPSLYYPVRVCLRKKN